MEDTQKIKVRLAKFGQPWANGLILTRESLKEFLSEERFVLVHDNFDISKPPIGRATNFKIDFDHLICDIEFFEHVIAPAVTYKGEDHVNPKEVIINGISVVGDGNRVKY